MLVQVGFLKLQLPRCCRAEELCFLIANQVVAVTNDNQTYTGCTHDRNAFLEKRDHRFIEHM